MTSAIPDNGTPQALMERLVARYELGQILIRRGYLTPEAATAYRACVTHRVARNLYEALEVTGAVPADVLEQAFADGHYEVTRVFLALKRKLVTTEMLRPLFEQAERENRSLIEVMREHGIDPPDPPSGPDGPRTPAPIMPRPGDPGAEAVG